MGVQIAPVVGQQPGERALGQQAHVLGEHGEEAPHEEAGDAVGIVAAALQRGRDFGEVLGEGAGDGGGAPRGVERERIRPHLPQRGADALVAQVVEEDTVARLVGERDVVLALPREVGVQVDAVADVHHEQEGRPAVGVGEGAGVAEGLVLGPRHGALPGAAPAVGVPVGADGLVDAERLGLGGRRLVAALLGFQHEAALLVQVDEAALAVLAGAVVHPPLEDVIVGRRVGPGRIGTGHAEHVTQLAEEELVVGSLGRAGTAPALDEGVNAGR